MTTADDGHMITFGGDLTALTTNSTGDKILVSMVVDIKDREEVQALVNRYQLRHRSQKLPRVEIIA